MPRRRYELPGGWYCTQCRTVVRTLPAGLVTCQNCGALGLTGFDGPYPPPRKEHHAN